MKGSVGCFWYNRSPLFHFTPWLKICPQLVMYQSSCSARRASAQRKLLCPNDLQTTIVVNAKCDRELGAWTEPKWLEGNAGEPCGLWCGNLEGWFQSPSCHRDFWADMSQVHTVPPVIWATAPLLISSLITNPCNCSWIFSSFFVLLSPTVSVLRLGVLLGSAVYDKESFLTKVLSRIANRSGGSLQGRQFLRFPTYQCELKRFH